MHYTAQEFEFSCIFRNGVLMQYFKVCLYVLFANVLVACGGSNGGGDDSSGPSLDEISLSDDIFDQYSGVKTGANIDASSMDLFVAIALSGPYEVPLDYSNSSAAIMSSTSTPLLIQSSNSKTVSARKLDSVKVNETEGCLYGGEQTVKGTLYENFTGVLEIQYEQCSEGDVIYHGNVSIKIIDGRDSTYQAISYFKKLQVSQGDKHTRLSGRQHRIDSDYGSTVEMVSDLVVVDLDTNAQLKFENYKTKSSCTNCSYADNDSYEGRIYHSDFGYLDVLTPEPLNDGSSYTNNGLVGQLSFLSSSGQSFLITYEYGQVFKQSTINRKFYSVRVQLDGDSDGLFEQEAIFPFELAFLFDIYDIADSDDDQMTDGWERLFGFNPTIDDSAIDSDLDGYSNLEEFLYGGNPLSDSIVPLVTDLSIELSESYDSVRGGRAQTIYVTINNPNIVYGAKDLEIIVTKTSNIEWEDYDRDGWTYLNDNQISQTLEYLSQDSRRAVSIKVLGEPGEYSVSASVTSLTSDTNLTNNQNSLSSSFAPRETNIGLIANSYLIGDGFSNHDSAAIDYEHSFRILVTNWGPDDSKNTIFRMSLPQHLEVLSASYNVENISSGDCTVSEEIQCDLGTFFINAASYQGHVQIDVKGVSEGIGEYTATITSDSIDSDPENNQITKEIFVGQSLKPIQDQIDAAEGPIEINLSAGMYVGGLNFFNKGVTLNGNDGSEETIVRTSSVSNEYNSFHVGSNSTVRNIRFSGREARAYSSPAINISGQDILIENNIIEHNGSNVVGVDGWAQNVIISGNTFKNSKANNSLCHVIGLDGPGPYRIENNLIYNTDCTAIMLFKSFNQPGQSSASTIINNTIINNVAGISDLVMYESSNFRIANNIIVKNQTGLIIRQGNAGLFENSYNLPVISNNFFFENQEDVSVNRYLGLGFIEDGTNFYEDPIFVDVAAYNFELNTESPAIDAGSNIDAPLYDLNEILRPQDGDGDGIPQIDIGAFERSH